jgi:cytochrome c oxidase subunit 2
MSKGIQRNERTPVGWMVVHGVIASAVGIAIGILIEWFPEQGSTQASSVDHLWDVLIWVSVPVFVTVMIIVLFSVVNFRMRPGEEDLDGPPIHGNTRLEVIWTAIPAMILVGLCTYTIIVLDDIEEAKANTMVINVTGQQFAWRYEYPQPTGKPVKSPDVLYLAKGRPVKFDVRAFDVIHDFWVPQFRMKVDAVPGLTTSYRITPTRLGTYPVVCAELCGLGHSVMRSTVKVVTPAAFDAWMAKQKAPAGAAGGTAATGGKPAPKVDGKAVFEANGCGGCHTLADAGTSSQTGPDLDKVLKGKDAAFIKTSIQDPSAEIAAGYQDIMPKTFADSLSPEELDALVEYLGSVAGK